MVGLCFCSTAEAARIIYPPEAQTIIVTKGQTLILECVASGIPPPRVTWAKDGSSVSSYNKTRFLLSNLLIDTITEEDSGTYSCMADNGVGEAAAAFVLYNVQVFEPPEVSMELSQQIITWGQSAKFTCKVRGNPQPTVVWLRNAVPLFSSHRIQLSRKVLWVSSVGPEDEGIYQCMAENEVGSAQAMVQLRTARPETTTLKPQQGSAGDSAQSAMSPARLSSSEKMLKDKVVLLRPKPTTPAASVQCTTKELVSLAEAPVILSSPRTTKTDSYELLWRPRHGGRVPILYYVIKHRKTAVTVIERPAAIQGEPLLADLPLPVKPPYYPMALQAPFQDHPFGETPMTPSGQVLMDEFQLMRPDAVDKVLGQVRPTTCLLEPCPWLLTKAKHRIGSWILEVINASLWDGWVPAPLKEAVIRPVLKKASLDPEVATSYRLVANIPLLGKMLEWVVAGQLQVLLDETDYLDPFQSCFRPRYCTESALVTLYDDLCRGSASLLVLLDLSAAFTTIDHGILLDRLAGLGVGSTAWQ
ncbi:Brother of CDO [Varanus komodoensis]|nr:Brother of CDO [Varanus komodoensis]